MDERITELEQALSDVLGRFYESVDEIGEPTDCWACGWVGAPEFERWRAIARKNPRPKPGEGHATARVP